MLDKLFIEADEIDYKEVFRNPLRWFGFIYPYFIIMLVAGGMFWVFNMGNSYNNQIPITIHEPHLADTLSVALVNESTAKIIGNSVHATDGVSNLKNEIYADNSEAAQIFKCNVSCPMKALYSLGNDEKWRVSSADFVNLISSTISTNGYKTSFLTLSQDKIDVVFNYLNEKFPAQHLTAKMNDE